MSAYMEIIYPQQMVAKLFKDGEVISEYKVEQCDKCSKIARLDAFGYVKSDPAMNLVWFCIECR